MGSNLGCSESLVGCYAVARGFWLVSQAGNTRHDCQGDYECNLLVMSDCAQTDLRSVGVNCWFGGKHIKHSKWRLNHTCLMGKQTLLVFIGEAITAELPFTVLHVLYVCVCSS